LLDDLPAAASARRRCRRCFVNVGGHSVTHAGLLCGRDEIGLAEPAARSVRDEVVVQLGAPGDVVVPAGEQVGERAFLKEARMPDDDAR
jgi:hypothetical protein